MQTQFDRLASEALTLTPDERAAFVQLLSASLDDDDDALAIEVERRIAEIENGATAVIPMDEALARARAGIK